MMRRFLPILMVLLLPALLAADAGADLATYLQRKSALKPDDIAGRLDLARWCRARELNAQMADLCTEVLALDPASKAAYPMLREYDASHTMPNEPDMERALLKELKERFGRDFKIKNTRHFTIAYDTTDAFAAARGGQLELAYSLFYLYFDTDHLRPAFLQKRLVSLVFNNYEDYRKYAREVDGQNIPWAAGYYSGRTNRSAFYDDSSGPAAAKIDKSVSDMQAQIADLTKQIADDQKANKIAIANDLIRQRNEVSSRLLATTQQTGAIVDKLNAIKTLHEATHQLSFNTGIQNRFVEYPLWLSEGIATGFESESREGNRGPAVINLLRIGTLQAALQANKMVPLKTFLTTVPNPSDTNAIMLFYSESWGLLHFLYRTDRPGLDKYLNAYLAQTPGRRMSPEQHLVLFKDAFGDDLDALEERWKKYLQGIK